jgi:hypothetical protein
LRCSLNTKVGATSPPIIFSKCQWAQDEPNLYLPNI